MLSVSRCHKCDKKADAKDGDVLLCTEHWLEIYGGLNGKSQSMVDGHGGRRDVHDTRRVVREARREPYRGL